MSGSYDTVLTIYSNRGSTECMLACRCCCKYTGNSRRKWLQTPEGLPRPKYTGNPPDQNALNSVKSHLISSVNCTGNSAVNSATTIHTKYTVIHTVEFTAEFPGSAFYTADRAMR